SWAGRRRLRSSGLACCRLHVVNSARFVQSLAGIAGFVAIVLAACGSQAASTTPGNSVGADWNEVVSAANREGVVVATGSGNNDLPTVLTAEFNKRYPKIRVDFSSDTGSQATPKLLAEHSSGKSFTDVTMHGADGSYPLVDA